MRERGIYFKSHISWWEHSSHFRLIGRGVPSVSVVSQLVYNFLCLASPKENPQVPMKLRGMKSCQERGGSEVDLAPISNQEFGFWQNAQSRHGLNGQGGTREGGGLT